MENTYDNFFRCQDEPIHIPNFIQPIGYFVCFDTEKFDITHISENVLEIFSNMQIGSNIKNSIPNLDEIIDKFQKTHERRGYFYEQKIITANGEEKHYDLIVSNLISEQFIIEILPINVTNDCIGFCMAELIDDLIRTTNTADLFDLVTDYIYNQIGYDRVMIYKFDKENNGQVICEKKSNELESYLDLHYPASDIPEQARALYLKNHIRIISDSSYTPNKVLTNSKNNIDMTYSFLRSVSPIHLEYMNNMGVVASMTISLIVDGKLWGLIACHNQAPITPGIKTINECEYIGKITSSIIKLHTSNHRNSEFNKFTGKIDVLLEQFRKHEFFDTEEIITKNLKHIKELFDADGIIIAHDNFMINVDIELPNQYIHELKTEVIKFLETSNNQYLITDSLLKHLPILETDTLKECSGVIAFEILEETKLYLILTRTQKERLLSWGGNPDEKIADTSKKYLSPRQSFNRFMQKVEYTSQDWDDNLEEKLNIFITKVNSFHDALKTKFNLHLKTTQLQEAQEEKAKHNEQLIELLLRIIEMRDAYTAGHTVRVAKICDLLAIELGASDTERLLLSQAAKLHDIGKVIIPDSILLKPGKLNENEYEIIKLHLKVGYEMLSTIEYYRPIAELMKYHHEKYDGSGYPDGIKGNEIPKLSRIMIVADAVDAMTTNRIYQKRKTLDQAIEEIRKLSGTFYHPEVVNALEKITQQDLIEVAETSQIPLTKMEHERFSFFFKDQMTGFYNEPYLWMILNKQIPQYNFEKFFLVELHSMSDYNKINGWHSGNILINNVSKILLKRFDNKLIFRLFGDSFLICFSSVDEFNDATKNWKELKLSTVYTSSRAVSKLALIEELQSLW